MSQELRLSDFWDMFNNFNSQPGGFNTNSPQGNFTCQWRLPLNNSKVPCWRFDHRESPPSDLDHSIQTQFEQLISIKSRLDHKRRNSFSPLSQNYKRLILNEKQSNDMNILLLGCAAQKFRIYFFSGYLLQLKFQTQ